MVEATEDWEFLRDMGAEILFETAVLGTPRAFIEAREENTASTRSAGPMSTNQV